MKLSHVPDYAEDWFTLPSVRILTPWEPEASNGSLLPRKIAPLLGFQPNIIFILTDDQDRLLGTTSDYDTLGPLAVMPQLRKGLMNEGAVIDNFFVNTPICCPSRTEFLTGRYFHNVGPPSRSGMSNENMACLVELLRSNLSWRCGLDIMIFLRHPKWHCLVSHW